MRQTILEIQAMQGKIISLLHEYDYAKRFQLMCEKYNRVYIIKDGFVLDSHGKILVDGTVHKERIKSFIRLRAIPEEQILRIDAN